MKTKTEILDAMEAYVRQRPNITADDYGGKPGAIVATKIAGQQRTDALAMIAAARADADVDAGDLALALSGTFALKLEGGQMVEACELGPMAFRGQACCVLAHALALRWRGVAGKRLQWYAGQRMSRGTARRWFS